MTLRETDSLGVTLMADFLPFDALWETVRSFLSREKPVNYLSANNLKGLFLFLAQTKRLPVCTFDYCQTSPRQHSHQPTERSIMYLHTVPPWHLDTLDVSYLHLPAVTARVLQWISSDLRMASDGNWGCSCV